MILKILATAMLCAGMTYTETEKTKENSFVLNTPKKENITNNYRIDANLTNEIGQTFTNEPTTNTYYPTGDLRTYKANIRNGNSYVNILGNVYYQLLTCGAVDDQNNNITIRMYENKNIIGDNLDYKVAQRTEMGYFLKLTPYNYNKNTEMYIRNSITIEEWETQYVEWYAYEIYYIRNIYISTNSWDQYLDMQMQKYLPYNIGREIENVDNGFYYTKQQELIQIGYNSISNNRYVDEIQIQLTPNIDNYYYIEYIPVIRPVNMGGDTQQEILYPMKGSFYPNSEGISIEGTNIIPDGTYEVIDIPSLMFEILGMPFAFVSQAFNLTLFPGTPYQVNIANLFLSIIAILVFTWIITVIIKSKAG